MRVAQSDVSKIERRRDLLVSTLASYVAATGGRLELVARYPDGAAVLELGAPDR